MIGVFVFVLALLLLFLANQSFSGRGLKAQPKPAPRPASRKVHDAKPAGTSRRPLPTATRASVASGRSAALTQNSARHLSQKATLGTTVGKITRATHTPPGGSHATALPKTEHGLGEATRPRPAAAAQAQSKTGGSATRSPTQRPRTATRHPEIQAKAARSSNVMITARSPHHQAKASTEPNNVATTTRHPQPRVKTTKSNSATMKTQALSTSKTKSCLDVVSNATCCKDYAEFVRPRHKLSPARPVPPGKRCSRVLLIIVFNSAMYDHAPFLRRLYKPVFSDIALYGPKDSSAYNVTGCDRMPVRGKFMHILIAQATVEHPGYDGYMWVADDQVFNYKLVLPEMDPAKIWMGLHYYGDNLSPNIFDTRRHDWKWSQAAGLPAYRAAYQCIPRVYLDRSLQWFHRKDCVTLMMSDFGYLPRRSVAEFRLMAYTLRKVHMETAFPTTFFFISRSTEDFQVVDKEKTVLYVWGGDRINPIDKLKKDTRLFHPIKLFRRPGEQQRLWKRLNRLWGLHNSKPMKSPWLPCT